MVRAFKPNVTIFADASHDHRAKVAGWAAWIKADGEPSVTCGAAFKVALENPSDAELCALANALTVAHLRNLLRPGDTIMLQSDCSYALSILREKIAADDRPAAGGLPINQTKRRLKLTVSQTAAVAAIRDLVAAKSLILVTRHVKGHKAGKGRQWVNRRVDVLARSLMRKARSAKHSTKGGTDGRHDGI